MSLANENFFQELADGAPVMIWMSGLDLGCFYFNRAWLEFRGRTLEQEAGNGWAEGVHPDDLQRCVSHYVSCFERRVSFAMSYRLLNAEGRYRWILDRGAPHHDSHGEFLGFFGGCADLENDAPVSRNAELGRVLAEMKEFARRIATEGGAPATAGHRTGAVPLQVLARNLHKAHAGRDQQRKDAAAKMEQLATDMLTYRQIARGECIS